MEQCPGYCDHEQCPLCNGQIAFCNCALELAGGDMDKFNELLNAKGLIPYGAKALNVSPSDLLG